MSVKASLVLVCVALAGCSDSEPASSPAASTPGSDVSTQVATAEWKAVIDDWYVDGTIDEPHRCVAIREAIEQLPSRDYSEVYADLLGLARRGCE